jgi:hypothetical protein
MWYLIVGAYTASTLARSLPHQSTPPVKAWSTMQSEARTCTGRHAGWWPAQQPSSGDLPLPEPICAAGHSRSRKSESERARLARDARWRTMISPGEDTDDAAAAQRAGRAAAYVRDTGASGVGRHMPYVRAPRRTNGERDERDYSRGVAVGVGGACFALPVSTLFIHSPVKTCASAIVDSWSLPVPVGPWRFHTRSP